MRSCFWTDFIVLTSDSVPVVKLTVCQIDYCKTKIEFQSKSAVYAGWCSSRSILRRSSLNVLSFNCQIIWHVIGKWHPFGVFLFSFQSYKRSQIFNANATSDVKKTPTKMNRFYRFDVKFTSVKNITAKSNWDSIRFCCFCSLIFIIIEIVIW